MPLQGQGHRTRPGAGERRMKRLQSSDAMSPRSPATPVRTPGSRASKSSATGSKGSKSAAARREASPVLSAGSPYHSGWGAAESIFDEEALGRNGSGSSAFELKSVTEELFKEENSRVEEPAYQPTSAKSSRSISRNLQDHLDIDGYEDSPVTKVLQKKLQVARARAREQEELIRQLENRQDTLEADNHRLANAHEQAKGQIATLLTKLDDSRATWHNSDGQVDILHNKLEEAKRKLNLAEHAKNVSANEASLAVEARLEAEREAVQRTGSLRDQLTNARAQVEQLQASLQHTMADLDAQKSERDGIDALHTAQTHDLLARIETLELNLKTVTAEKESLEKDNKALCEYEAASALLRKDLQQAQLAHQRVQKELETVAQSRDNAERELADAKVRLERESQLRTNIEGKAETLREQIDLLVAGNSTLHVKHEEAERQRTELVNLQAQLRESESRAKAAATDLTKANEKIEALVAQVESWNHATQLLQLRITTLCARASDAEHCGDSMKEGQDDFMSHRQLPEGLTPVLRSLDALERINVQVLKRATKSSLDLVSAQDKLRSAEDDTQELKGKLQMAVAEREQYLRQRARHREALLETKDHLAQTQHAAATLEQELEYEKSSHAKLAQKLRHKAMRVIMTVAQPEEFGVDDSLEDLFDRVCSLLELAKSKNGTEETLGSMCLESQDEGVAPRRVEEGIAWRKACEMLLSLHMGTCVLVSRLCTHKSILEKLASRAERSERECLNVLHWATKALSKRGESMSLLLPSARERQQRSFRHAAIAVMAVNRLRRQGQHQSVAPRYRLPYGKGASVALVACPDASENLVISDIFTEPSKTGPTTSVDTLGRLLDRLSSSGLCDERALSAPSRELVGTIVARWRQPPSSLAVALFQQSMMQCKHMFITGDGPNQQSVARDDASDPNDSPQDNVLDPNLLTRSRCSSATSLDRAVFPREFETQGHKTCDNAQDTQEIVMADTLRSQAFFSPASTHNTQHAHELAAAPPTRHKQWVSRSPVLEGRETSLSFALAPSGINTVKSNPKQCPKRSAPPPPPQGLSSDSEGELVGGGALANTEKKPFRLVPRSFTEDDLTAQVRNDLLSMEQLAQNMDAELDSLSQAMARPSTARDNSGVDPLETGRVRQDSTSYQPTSQTPARHFSVGGNTSSAATTPRLARLLEERAKAEQDLNAALSSVVT